jgi:hypothetical protein
MVFGDILDTVKDPLGGVVDVLVDLFNDLLNPLESIAEFALSVFGFFKDLLLDLLNALVECVENDFDTDKCELGFAVYPLNWLWDTLKELFECMQHGFTRESGCSVWFFRTIAEWFWDQILLLVGCFENNFAEPLPADHPDAASTESCPVWFLRVPFEAIVNQFDCCLSAVDTNDPVYLAGRGTISPPPFPFGGARCPDLSLDPAPWVDDLRMRNSTRCATAIPIRGLLNIIQLAQDCSDTFNPPWDCNVTPVGPTFSTFLLFLGIIILAVIFCWIFLFFIRTKSVIDICLWFTSGLHAIFNPCLGGCASLLCSRLSRSSRKKMSVGDLVSFRRTKVPTNVNSERSKNTPAIFMILLIEQTKPQGENSNKKKLTATLLTDGGQTTISAVNLDMLYIRSQYPEADAEGHFLSPRKFVQWVVHDKMNPELFVARLRKESIPVDTDSFLRQDEPRVEPGKAQAGRPLVYMTLSYMLYFQEMMDTSIPKTVALSVFDPSLHQ